jgi:hypothetical protein
LFSFEQQVELSVLLGCIDVKSSEWLRQWRRWFRSIVTSREALNKELGVDIRH